jgi:hypothetical protein
MIGISFTFKDYAISEDRTESVFRYSLVTDEQVFEYKEKMKWPEPLKVSPAIDSLHKSLHLALGMSYYKTFIPPDVNHGYELTQPEAEFWNTAYTDGLGEFFYKNDLDPSVLPQFKPQEGARIESDKTLELQQRALLGIGGGKDSIVAGELLLETGLDLAGFVLATKSNTGITKEVADVMGLNLAVVERTIDPDLIYANDLQGAYNGHVPISLIFALVGSVLAIANNAAYVIVANESSASIPQVQWHNREVNHQWSKSLEFEVLFQNYIHETVTLGLQYFSAIRPLSSIGVARLFAKYPKYFEHFTSDNSLFKIKQSEREHPRWSKDSSKSLSSFMLLAPWLENEDLMRAFGKNFLDDAELLPMFKDLLGVDGATVLDCVGTPDELKASMAQLVSFGKYADTALLTYAVQNNLLEGSGSLADMSDLTSHAIPDEIGNRLIANIQKKL